MALTMDRPYGETDRNIKIGGSGGGTVQFTIPHLGGLPNWRVTASLAREMGSAFLAAADLAEREGA